MTVVKHSGALNIKDIPESELKKHKVRDIIGFIKDGNLSMVHGLINYYGVGQAVVMLRGCTEEFAMSKTEKVTMAEWNPVLVAIAFKRVDIVKYFIQELKISMKLACLNPAFQLN